MDLQTVDHLLLTTRTVRKRLDFDRPVEPEVIERCIEIATQAPTGSNRQGWYFMVITDSEKRARIAELYKRAFDTYLGPMRAAQAQTAEANSAPARQLARVLDSAAYLAENVHNVPVLINCCIEGRRDDPAPVSQAPLYGSILPAAWSLMLALRARGLGSAWTTLHLRYELEAAAVLGIPNNVTQSVLLPVAYFKGEDFKPARRLPAREKTYWNSWGQMLSRMETGPTSKASAKR